VTNRPMSEIIRHQKPVTLPPDATVRHACAVMHDRRIGAVLVTHKERLVGIFTGRDAVRMVGKGENPEETTLERAMTPNPDTMSPGRKAIEALRLMNDGGFRHIPVVDDAGKVLGIVSRGDFRGLEQDRLDEETGYWERI